MPLFCLALAFAISACAVFRTSPITKIALVAPFEGRYREVGYEALYAARLALADVNDPQIELLAVDDGGTEAANRAAALAQDPQVIAALVLGYDATTPEALRAFGDIPVVVVGEWGAEPVTDSVFIYSNPEISPQITTPPRVSITDAAALPAPFIGGDVLALDGFAELRGSLDGVTVLSSGSLPSAEFIARYKGDDQFAPDPGLLATLSYDATSLTVYGWAAGSREGVGKWLAPAFRDGYYNDAQVHAYHFQNGGLTADDTVE